MEEHGSHDEGHGEEGGEEGHAPDVSHMSPQEIEELQKKNCVFCHIGSGKVPARKVYEDEECLAVLDINPATQGHMLLMPKEHYTVMFQVPGKTLGHIFSVAKGLSQASLKALQGKGATIFAANGVAAGQRAPHFMLHIIPRSPGDSVGLYIPSRALPGPEGEKIADAVAAALEYKREKEAKAEAHTPEAKHEELEPKLTAEKPASDLDAVADFLAGKGGGK